MINTNMMLQMIVQSNPQLRHLLNASPQEIEKYTRNVCVSKNINPDKAILQIKQALANSR